MQTRIDLIFTNDIKISPREIKTVGSMIYDSVNN